jgi:hypothetical protein
MCLASPQTASTICVACDRGWLWFVHWMRVMGHSGMVKQVERGPCPLCRRELEWNTMVEYMRHIKANKLEIDGKYG